MIVKGSLKCPICGSLGAIYNDLEELSLFEKKEINGFFIIILMILDIIPAKKMDG